MYHQQETVLEPIYKPFSNRWLLRVLKLSLPCKETIQHQCLTSVAVNRHSSFNKDTEEGLNLDKTFDRAIAVLLPVYNEDVHVFLCLKQHYFATHLLKYQNNYTVQL